jgi:DNA-binding NarL/FixJ family response regulator
MGNAMPQIHVLLVDASPVFLEAASNLLQLDPAIATVNCARSAQEAAEIVARRRPTLVLVDLVLPGIGGLAVVELMKEMSDAPRVLLMSMMSRPEVCTSAMWNGADGFVSKPDFETQISKYLGRFFVAVDRVGNP